MSTTTTADQDVRGTRVVEPAATIDLYRDIHKGIRAELFATTLRAGSLDPSARDERLDLAARVDGLVGVLHSHAEHEDVAVQPAIEVHLPAVAERIRSDHVALDARIADIRELASSVAESTGTVAREAGHQLYLELASFTGAYLGHQDLEERLVMPALGAALGPAGVLAIHEAIITSIPPAEMAASLALMVPAMNVDDRTELLGGMRAGAPAEAFAGVWGLVGTLLAPGDVAELARRLDIAG